jgi:imidazole glycerol-phosphate synthase subunit HisF
MKRKMHAGAEREIYQRARNLRNRSTPAEDILWGFLKGKPHGFKFRRQHPYSIYILDFYCHALKLVIEVDGSIHNRKEVKTHDKQRQDLLENDGLTVLRFTNEEILTNFSEIINKIETLISSQMRNETSEPCSADAPL